MDMNLTAFKVQPSTLFEHRIWVNCASQHLTCAEAEEMRDALTTEIDRVRESRRDVLARQAEALREHLAAVEAEIAEISPAHTSEPEIDRHIDADGDEWRVNPHGKWAVYKWSNGNMHAGFTSAHDYWSRPTLASVKVLYGTMRD